MRLPGYTPDHPLFGAQAKLLQSVAHHRALDRGIEQHFDEVPFGVGLQYDPQRPYYASTIRLSPDLRPPTTEWSLLVGDIVHNLRSCLDHIAWQLATRTLGHSPPNSARRSISFPIQRKEADYPGAMSAYLRPVDVRRLRKYQPFRKRRHPERHRLAVLRELSNEDKHRLLVVTVATLDKLNWEFEIEGGDIEWLQLFRHVPLEDGAKLARMRVRHYAPVAHIQYQENPTTYVALDKRFRVHGDMGHVTRTLSIIGVYVTKILWDVGETFE